MSEMDSRLHCIQSESGGYAMRYLVLLMMSVLLLASSQSCARNQLDLPVEELQKLVILDMVEQRLQTRGAECICISIVPDSSLGPINRLAAHMDPSARLLASLGPLPLPVYPLSECEHDFSEPPGRMVHKQSGQRAMYFSIWMPSRLEDGRIRVYSEFYFHGRYAAGHEYTLKYADEGWLVDERRQTWIS